VAFSASGKAEPVQHQDLGGLEMVIFAALVALTIVFSIYPIWYSMCK
jgi:hypothetical protein